ncbi:hypothetical protein ABIA35_008009 [Catenulispora sp. MAP12-49]
MPAGVSGGLGTDWWSLPLFAAIIAVTAVVPLLVISWLVASLLFLIVFAL